jgi:hypothetical protein
MEEIKKAYDEWRIGYDIALARLEALGMWASDADDYLKRNAQ